MISSLDIIIPAYNEEHRIRPVLEEYLRVFDDTVHFIVVPNGCTDRTEEVVQQVQQRYPDRIRIHVMTDVFGKGNAILAGWRIATAPVVGFTDADGATNAHEFQKLVTALDGHDGVIGSRFIHGAQVINRLSPLRTIMSYGFIVLVRSLLRLPFHDTQCGAKIFRRDCLLPLLDEIHETNMVFDVELLQRLHRAHADILEIPLRWVDQPGSAALGTRKKFLHHAGHMLRSLLRLRWRTRRQ